MATVLIELGGVDVTAHVIYGDAEFITQTGGAPGTCHFRVKDAEHLFNFHSGMAIVVSVDGASVFAGYAMLVNHKYAFSVDRVTDTTKTPRIWDISGPDLQILFSKRFVYNHSNPGRDLHTYPPGVSDAQVIEDYVENFPYLDLEGDDISLAGVEPVGTPNPDLPGSIGAKGNTWADAMQQTAALTGAVWYLGPDRVLHYADANVEDAPFVLSDQPNDTTSFGYSFLTWTDDGTQLVNDALVWGAGVGSSKRVYRRTTDTASEALHGHWQHAGDFQGGGLYRQTSVDKVSRSIVYGSPQNLHGAKDPSIQVHCRVRQGGLQPGMKARIISNVYGLDDVFPIRRMRIFFPSPTDVLYDLDLSREIDTPWSIWDFPPFRFPHPFPPPSPPPIWKPPTTSGGDEVCTVFDDFNRTVGPDDWGSSTPTNVPWSFADHGSVDGSYGLLGPFVQPFQLSASVTITDANLPAVLQPNQTVVMKVVFKLDQLAGMDVDPDTIRFELWNGGGVVDVELSPDPFFGSINLADNTTGFLVGGNFSDWAIDTLYCLKWQQTYNGAGAVKVWRASNPEPPAWLITTPSSAVVFNGHNNFNIRFDSNQGTSATLFIDSLQFCTPSGPNCTLLDSFNRVLVGDLGVTDNGSRPWQIQTNTVNDFGCGFGSVVAYGAYAQTTTVGRLKSYLATLPTDPWAVGTYFQFLIIFRMEAHVGVSFVVALSDSTQLAADESQIYWQASINNSGTLFAAVGSDVWADGASFFNPGFVVDTDYIMEGYVQNEVSAGIRVYANGDNVPDWTSFTFSTGGSSSVGPGLILNIRADQIHSSSVFHWRDLVFCGLPVASSSGSSGTVGSYGCEVPAVVSTTELKTSYPYIAGTVRLFIDGVLQRLGIDFTAEGFGSTALTLAEPLPHAASLWVCYQAYGLSLGAP